MGDNFSSIDEHASLLPSPAAPCKASVLWPRGIRLEAIANLAHELRTPVQVLLGYLDILREDHFAEFSDETRIVLNRMNANVHDLAQAIDNLMHFALSEINAEVLIDEGITPAALIAEIMPALEATNQQKQLKLEFDFAGAPALFWAPRRPLKAIILNLAVNAIKFTDVGVVTVALRQARDSGFANAIEVEITDSGPGLSPEILAQASEPFSQLSNTSERRFRGLGLGLAVVQRSVAVLGGTIELRTRAEHGSNFLVTIPIRLRAEARRVTRIARTRPSTAMIPPTPLGVAPRILR
jgi:signal transduction histidine kinase